jgi:hypothetical protein
MLKIHRIVLSPRIVKNGKELYHVNICAITGRNLQGISFNPSPVIWAVNRIRITLKFVGDMLPDNIKIDWNDFGAISPISLYPQSGH